MRGGTAPYYARCREAACGRTILMCLTRHGHWQPLDPNYNLARGEAREAGDIVLIGHGNDARAVVLTPEELADGQLRYRRKPHAATCAARKPRHAAA